MDDLLQEFIAETRETLEALSGEIVAWESAPDDRARLDAIFRFVHTVKGSCGFLDLPRLERLSHAAEDVLSQVRAGDRRPDRALVSAVLAVVDRIGEIVEAIDAGAALDNSGEELLIAALAQGADESLVAVALPTNRTPSRSVRLNVDLLDRMMSGMSDMVLARNELSRRLREGNVDPAVEASLERLSATVAEMRETVTRTRMQKVEALFAALPRLVRDTAATLGKSVAIAIEGAEVELDREMIEVMRDPLVHIVRNAIDHGLETPAERRAAGKRENGRLTVAARQAGNQIVIEVADDGRGIDVDRVIAKLAAGGADEAALRALPEAAKLALIFEPGFSTRDQVTALSGRGVGMDVVRTSIDQIGGRIELDNTPGRGLRITINVPLTLSIISTIIVGVGDQRFAVARPVIEEILAAHNPSVRIDRVGDARVATVRDRRLQVVELRALLHLPDRADRGDEMLLIVGIGQGSFAIVVDQVIDAEELVIKPAAPAVMAAGVYAGQTLPDSGRPMLLLDCAGIAAASGLRFVREVAIEEDEAAVGEPMVQLLLFVDLDGVRRAAPLAIVDRIEQANAASVRRSAGKLRLAIDGMLLPLATQGTVPDGGFAVLRLKDGVSELGYAIAEAADIVTVADIVAPATEPGPIAGVLLIDDEPVELLDPFWLFGRHADRAMPADPPLCLIEPDADGWMPAFLAPILRAAGYRVATAPRAGDHPAAILRLDGDVPPLAMPGEVPVLMLYSDAVAGNGAGGIYRYDRDTLLRALRECASGGGGR